jgi:hypothetical protein
MNQSLGTTSISALPTVPMVQQLPDFDKMHQQDNTPLIGAATPGMETMEPMAANFGGGAFGSAFGTNW